MTQPYEPMVKVDVRLPASLLAHIDSKASQLPGITRSDVIRNVLIERFRPSSAAGR